MEIRLKTVIIIHTPSLAVRTITPGTAGVVKGNEVYFYDTTRTSFVQFSLDTVMASDMFSVRNIAPPVEISLKSAQLFFDEHKPRDMPEREWEELERKFLATVIK